MSRLWGFGNNNKGQCGFGKNQSHSKPHSIEWALPLDLVSVAAGEDFSLALVRDGTVLAWGRASEGQLGNGSFEGSNIDQIPAKVDLGRERAVKIAAGHGHAGAITATGRLFVWGRIHQKARGALPTFGLAVSLPGLSDGIQETDGDSWARKMLANSSLEYFSGGADEAAKELDVQNFGTFQAVDQATPLPVALPGSAIDFALGYGFTVVVLAGGTVYAFGFNDSGQCGQGHRFNLDFNSPQPVKIPEPAIAVGAGQQHAVALIEGQSYVYVWGNGSLGQLGQRGGSLLPRKFELGSAVPNELKPIAIQEVRCGAHFTLAVASSPRDQNAHRRHLLFWGHQEYGQSGLTSGAADWDMQPLSARQIRQQSRPRLLPFISSSASLVACGHLHSLCFVRNERRVLSWGHPTSPGCLGRTSTQASAEPVALSVHVDSPVIALSAGRRHSLVLTHRNVCAEDFARSLSAASAAPTLFSWETADISLSSIGRNRVSMCVHSDLLQIRAPRLFNVLCFYERWRSPHPGSGGVVRKTIEIPFCRDRITLRAFTVYLYSGLLRVAPHRLSSLLAISKFLQLDHLSWLVAAEIEVTDRVVTSSVSSAIVDPVVQQPSLLIQSSNDFPSPFRNDFVKYLNSASGVVVKISAIPLHRWVLVARSQYFKIMLTGEFKEATVDCDTSTTIGSPFDDAVLKLIFQYIYCGSVPLTSENVVSLMFASDFYELKQLFSDCVLFLWDQLSHDNVISVLTLVSTDFNLPRLRAHCEFLITRSLADLEAVMQSAAFSQEGNLLPLEVARSIDRNLCNQKWWSKSPGEFVRLLNKQVKNSL